MKVQASAAFYAFLGAIFMIVFIFALLAQISTTQAALTNSREAINMFQPRWQVLLQIPIHVLHLFQ